MRDESLPVARLTEHLLDLALAIVIVQEHLVKDRVANLHIDEKFVVFISVSLHALMPLLKLIILCAELHRRIANTYLDEVTSASLSSLCQLLVAVCLAGGRPTQPRVVIELPLKHIGGQGLLLGSMGLLHRDFLDL